MFLKLFLPSGSTARLALFLATAVGLSWLFLHYDQGPLIEKVLLILAGGGGVLGLQKITQPRAN
jgi:hypothetical protein